MKKLLVIFFLSILCTSTYSGDFKSQRNISTQAITHLVDLNVHKYSANKRERQRRRRTDRKRERGNHKIQLSPRAVNKIVEQVFQLVPQLIH